MTRHWSTINVADCLVPVSAGEKGRILARDYRPLGRFPIVDQGQGLIAGWTDDESAVINAPLPIIIFGDHTRVFKFVDFPFARGADGTQLLLPKKSFDPLFFFYACRAIDLPARGYNRHFSVLKEKSIQFPMDIAEQQAIARVLCHAERSSTKQSELLKSLGELKRFVMNELFSNGLRGEEQKETEFGLVPTTWQVASLESVATIQTGIAKGRKFAEAEMIEIPYLRVANVQDGHLDLSEMKMIPIRKTEIDRYRLQEGDVVLTEGGDFDKLGRGFIWRGELDPCIHQNHVFAVRPDRGRMSPTFFAYLAQSPYGKAYFLKVAHKTTNLACINTTKLKAFPTILPPLDEQEDIVSILDALDRKIDLVRRKRLALEQLFKSLLHKMMAGEISPKELGMPDLEPPSADRVHGMTL